MIFRIALPLMLAFACIAPASAADAIKPLPTADLSKLSRENADEIRGYLNQFNKDKNTLKGSDLAESYANIGALHARVGIFDVAEIAFADAAAINPDDGRWPYLQALIALARGQEPAAKTFFERSFKLNASYLPARMALANVLVRDNELDRARAILEEFTKDNKTYPMPLAVLGAIALRQERNSEAVNLFKLAVAAEPQATQLYGGLALAQEKTGDKKGAEASRAKAGDVGPSLPDPMMARILPIVDLKAPLIASGAAAPASGGQAADEAPAAGPKQSAMVAASMSATSGDYDAARKTLDAALKQFPNDAEVLLAYARVEAAAGKFDAARSRARAATVAAPREVGPWYVQGLVEEAAGDDAAATAAFTKVLTIDNRNTRARIAIGTIQLRNGNTADAMKTYADAVLGSPESTDARAHLIAAQVLAGECADAVRETGGAASMNPRDAGIAELYVRVASTCRSANAEQRKRAMTMGENLYNSPLGSSAQVSEAYALALAAAGKWQDAEQTQAAAMFDVVNKGNEASIALYKDFYAKFQAKQLPDRPWAAAHPLLKPTRPTFKPASKPVTKSAAAKPAATPANK
ncbi:MAG: tetratricopeptide repeat protein [Dokdonella sp.]